MTQTTNFNLKIVEGSDKVNPLVDTNPNFQEIDKVMKANQDSGVQLATETLSGTTHAIVYTNKDSNVFRFKATSNYTTGDSFTVNGSPVTASTVSGESIPNGAFVINSSVLCILDGAKLTVIVPQEQKVKSVNSKTGSVVLTASDVGAATAEQGEKADSALLFKGFLPNGTPVGSIENGIWDCDKSHVPNPAPDGLNEDMTIIRAGRFLLATDLFGNRNRWSFFTTSWLGKE